METIIIISNIKTATLTIKGDISIKTINGGKIIIIKIEGKIISIREIISKDKHKGTMKCKIPEILSKDKGTMKRKIPKIISKDKGTMKRKIM